MFRVDLREFNDCLAAFCFRLGRKFGLHFLKLILGLAWRGGGLNETSPTG
jgi:hypothetical protein